MEPGELSRYKVDLFSFFRETEVSNFNFKFSIGYHTYFQ